ncbi:MAG TPA: acyltransferase [Bryobacteraceae bacterium]|nr:acyltransferase [Bryobacteraceae bacterium]
MGALPPQSSEHIPELDGVRATAIWMVLVAHLGFAYPPPAGALLWMPSAAVRILGHGWLGVDLFFVLSGFLITGILLDSRNRPKYFQRFYGRRALRILPVYFVSVGVMALFYANSGRYFLLSSLFMANLASLLSVSFPHGPGVLWSLAVEEHFYLLWPGLVRLMSRRTLAIVAAAIVLGTPVLRGLAASRGVPVEHIQQ